MPKIEKSLLLLSHNNALVGGKCGIIILIDVLFSMNPCPYYIYPIGNVNAYIYIFIYLYVYGLWSLVVDSKTAAQKTFLTKDVCIIDRYT